MILSGYTKEVNATLQLSQKWRDTETDWICEKQQMVPIFKSTENWL